MKTVDLACEDCTLADLLALARSESVLIHAATGEDFLLEPADDFDREVASLGRSERFMTFLKGRAEESGGRSLAEIRKSRVLRRK
ncbi:MAG: hypothetical protein FJ291_14790 [Planctomycetes bacterium]|nr:hypothetical protein [Planctomycetota bacterium]